MTLQEQLQAKLVEARGLLADGKIPEAKSAREEAEKLVEAIEEAKSLDAVSAKYAPHAPATAKYAGPGQRVAECGRCTEYQEPLKRNSRA